MTRYIVGIDPGVTTGFALWDADKKRLTEVTSMGIVEALLRTKNMRDAGSLHMVVFEDARLRTYFGTKGVEALQGAGSIKRDCSVWGEWLAVLGCAVLNVSPKNKGPKMDAERFARFTGWQGRTNEHGRDAAMLVWNRTAA